MATSMSARISAILSRGVILRYCSSMTLLIMAA